MSTIAMLWHQGVTKDTRVTTRERRVEEVLGLERDFHVRRIAVEIGSNVSSICRCHIVLIYERRRNVTQQTTRIAALSTAVSARSSTMHMLNRNSISKC
jgi:hypothetical protein